MQLTVLPRVWLMSRPGWEPVDLDWTELKPRLPKPRLCGWVQVNSSPSMTSLMCTFCRPGHSQWPWRCHRQPAVTVGSGHCLKMRVRHQSTCFLDYCNSVVIRHLRRKVAVGSEHCRSSGYWYSTFRPHNASAPSATLATSMLVCWLQGCHVHSSVTGLAFQGVGPQILHSLDIHHGLLVHTTEMGSPQKF